MPLTNLFGRIAPLTLLCTAALPALATNGMNMEGYGPVSTAMGGASQAMDHGTAAMAQNPATLGLMNDGSRFDLAVGRLGPKVSSSVPGFSGSRTPTRIPRSRRPTRRSPRARARRSTTSRITSCRAAASGRSRPS